MDQLLIQFLHDMAHTQNDEPLKHNDSNDQVKLNHEVDSDQVSAMTEASWLSYIQKGDDAINRYIPESGFTSIIVHRAVQWIHDKGVDWIHQELNHRVIPLYTGTLPPLQIANDLSNENRSASS